MPDVTRSLNPTPFDGAQGPETIPFIELVEMNPTPFDGDQGPTTIMLVEPVETTVEREFTTASNCIFSQAG